MKKLFQRFIKYLYYKNNCYVDDTLNDFAHYVCMWALPPGEDIVTFKISIMDNYKSQGIKFTPLYDRIDGEIKDNTDDDKIKSVKKNIIKIK